jgi:hypothetical protein
MNWKSIVSEHLTAPANNLAPPCTSIRVSEAQSRLGQMPAALSAMFAEFNGGELFVGAMPFITLFGLSNEDSWTTDAWSVDASTQNWRSVTGRHDEWVFGISNYGSIFVLDQLNKVCEWDPVQRTVLGQQESFEHWLSRIISEGAASLEE